MDKDQNLRIRTIESYLIGPESLITLLDSLKVPEKYVSAEDVEGARNVSKSYAFPEEEKIGIYKLTLERIG